jgi:hypothetical protein
MVIKRDEHHRFRNRTQSKRSEKMKIAGAIQQERHGQIALAVAKELFNEAPRRGETQLRTPTSRINYRESD